MAADNDRLIRAMLHAARSSDAMPRYERPPPHVDALMPQTDEERERFRWRNVLPWMAATLPPVSAYLGGQRLAEGVVEGRPSTALLGAGQIVGAMPGVLSAAAGAARNVPLPGRGWPPPITGGRPEWLERGVPWGGDVSRSVHYGRWPLAAAFSSAGLSQLQPAGLTGSALLARANPRMLGPTDTAARLGLAANDDMLGALPPGWRVIRGDGN